MKYIYILFSGTGKGGSSIWGRKFEDELRDGLKVKTIHILHNLSAK